MSAVLGFDIAQSCGWAYLVDGEVLGYGVLKLPNQDFHSHVDNLDKICTLISTYPPKVVAFERVDFSSTAVAHASHWRIRTLLEMAIASHADGALVRDVGVSTLKKWATGYGRASKAQMVAAANSLYSLNLVSQEDAPAQGIAKAEGKRQEDMADALLVASWAAEQS